MSVFDLCSLQLTLFIMMLVGALLKKTGILDDSGKRCLSELCINVVIPCNIFKSCLIECGAEVLRSCAALLASAAAMELICLLINRVLFRSYAESRRKVLQYCTIVPMSGFLGNPIAEGIYREVGVLYTSIFLIPMRMVMWSVGTSYFVAKEGNERKKVVRNVMTHPCLVSVYLGLFCMLTGIRPPVAVLSAVQYIGGCNSALTMLIVGTILVDVPLRSICNRDTLRFALLRLGILPAVALGLGLLLRLESTALGVSVLMSGMPAGATAAIFAEKYGSDTCFATQNVVLTTLLSMLTLPLWAYGVG